MGDSLSERIRAELALENSPFLAALQEATKETSAFLQAIDTLGDELVPLADSEAKVTRQTREQADAARDAARHTQDLAEEEKFLSAVMEDVTKANDRAAEATRRKKDAVTDAIRQAAAYGRAMNQLSYALSDFFSAQGDIGQKFNSIANNLQMVAVQMGASGGMFMAITGVITLIQLLSRNWDSLMALFKSTDTTMAAESIDKITEALNKLNAAQQKQSDMRKASEAQKAAGRGFARALGGIGGAQGALQAGQDLGWDVGQLEEMLNRGLNGEEDAIDQLHDWLSSSGRGANGQMPLLSPLGGLYRGAVKERAGRRRAADAKMLTEEGARIEDETNAKDYNAKAADREAAAKQAQQRESQALKAVEHFGEWLRDSMAKFDERMAAREGRSAKVAQNWRDAKEVQQEAMMGYGQAIDLETAGQIAKQRQAAMKQLQSEAINTLIGTQADFMSEMQVARQQLAAARRLRDMNRTQQNMGGP